MKRLILAQILIFLALFLPGREVFALTKTDEYVRTANYFLKAGTDIKQSDYVNLAKFDLLVLPQEAGVYNKDLFSYLRQNNPDIIILAYTPTRSINLAFLDDGAGLRRQLLNNTDSSWYLYDQWGGVVSTWPNTESFNITSGWNSYLPQFVKNNILSTELWDGVFYDEVDADVSYKNNGNIDLNRDGIKDNASTADDAWRR